jgi:hypothetical protein
MSSTPFALLVARKSLAGRRDTKGDRERSPSLDRFAAGHRVAIVALAHRLAGILWAILRDGTSYRAQVSQVASSSS